MSDISECRICLEELDIYKNGVALFSHWQEPKECLSNTVVEDLQNVTQISVSNDDPYSKHLCKDCVFRLQFCCKFIFQVRDSDRVLRSRGNNENQQKDSSLKTSDKAWPKPISLEKSVNPELDSMEIEIKEEMISDSEFDDGGGFSTEEFVAPTMDIKIEPEEIQEQPNIVVNGTYSLRGDETPTAIPAEKTNGNVYYDEEFLDPVKEEPISEEENSDQTTTVDLPLDCLLCTKTFKSMSGLKAHVISQHSYKSVKRKSDESVSPVKKRNDDKYTCATCRRSFTTSTDLMVHETCHNKAVCYGCNCKFDTFEQLSKHRKRCKVINTKEIPKLKTLEDVIRPHIESPLMDDEDDTNKPMLKCDLCDEQFSDDYYMNIHKEIHHSVTNEENSNDIKVTFEISEVKSNLSDVKSSDVVNEGIEGTCKNETVVNKEEEDPKKADDKIQVKSEIKLDISEVKTECVDMKNDGNDVNNEGDDLTAVGDVEMNDDQTKMNSDDEKMETELESIFGV